MTRDTIGRYEVESEIGRGGMAAVFLAYDPRFRRKVAIKLVSVSLQDNTVFRERFEREAQLIAKIEHPAIVPVYDFGDQDDEPYLVMRYMPGGALTAKIKQGDLSVSYASQIMSQIAQGLDAVHTQGIVHRDLKPANILFDGFGNPAISDFGIAHFSHATTDLTGTAIIGTPSYMSPEQVRSDADLDGRSDIYALGVILFEMLTGSGPFRAATPLSVAMKHLTDPIPSIQLFRPELPVEIDRILRKAMAKDREMRYASASELASDLREVANSLKDQEPLVRRPVHALRVEDAATEIDIAEDAAASLPSSAEIGSSDVSDVHPSAASVSGPRRSLVPRIAGVAVLGLCAAIVCGSLGLLGAWSGLGLPGLSPAANQTVVPIRTATIAPPSESVVLLADDFSDPLSGWPTVQNARGSYSYQADGYHIVVDEVNSALWAMTTAQYDYSSVSVETRPIRSDKDGYYGLICRAQDDRNFYYFVIRNNGEYTIGKYKNAEFGSLLSEGWKRDDSIRAGPQLNRVRADCSKNTLRLYVNNVLLDEVADTDFSSGYSGLIAASLESRGFEVLFQNFLITEPDQ